jgi:hypothetical protein
MSSALIVALVSLVLGSGIGVAAIGFFIRAGREMQKLEDRATRLDELEETAGELKDMRDDVRTLRRRTTQLENTRETDGRRLQEVEVNARDHETRMRRVERAFSQSFPRVRLQSSPEIAEHVPADEDDDDTKRNEED